MFKKFTNGCVSLVQNYLPDAFIFCIILSLIVFTAAMPVTGMNFFEVADAWGNGVWSLLAFSMQMALVLVLGTAFASAKPIKKIIQNLAQVPKTATGAIIFVTLISMICCFLNWGFGLVVGALLAKEVAKTGLRVDYRLLIASAYSGFVVWHAGFSGSIPLTVATYNESLNSVSGGAITEAIPTSQTIFSPWNLIMVATVILVVAFLNSRMHPDDKDIVMVDPKLLVDEEEVFVSNNTPAEKIENSRILSILIAVISCTYLVRYFIDAGSIVNSLSLNIVNLIFLTLGILFHGTPINYVRAITAAAKGAGGILLQFPFYAGIMGIMTAAGPTGISLAGAISNVFVSISTPTTFPLFSFLSAGIVNFFVPSGGGQWAVQAPIMMPAGQALGVSPAVTAMAISWGDAWTNMLQPFWALPALGIAGLGARDIMGYCAVVLIATGIIISCGFLFLVPMFF